MIVESVWTAFLYGIILAFGTLGCSFSIIYLVLKIMDKLGYTMMKKNKND